MAVLLVVAFHAAPDVVANGFIGVDIFFVISGYLITGILVRKIVDNEFSIWWFLSRRIKRLFPALILVLTSVLIFGWFSLLADEYRLLGKHAVGGALFAANFLFAAEAGYFDVSALQKPLLHLWSLAVEEQFYLLFPIFLVFLYACRANILAALLIVFTCSLLFGIHESSSAPGRAFFLPFTRFWELLAGGMLAWGTFRWGCSMPEPGIRTATAVSGIGFCLIASALFLIPDGVAYPGLAALLPVAGAFCIILAGPRSGLNRVLLMNRPAIWFGLISYPLYLYHWPVLSYMAIIDGELPHRDGRLIAVFGSVLLAWMTYQFVEKRVRYHHSKTVMPVLLMSTLIAIGAGGGIVVYISDGMKKRTWLANVSFHSGNTHPVYPEYQLGDKWICPHINTEKHPNCTSTGEYPSVVVVGDSHALATYAMLRHSLGTQNGDIGLLGIGGCPSLLGIVSHDPGTVDTRQCLEHMDTALKAILEQKHVKHIVLANRIALYVNRSGVGDRERGLSGWIFRKKGNTSYQPAIDVFFDALHETVFRAHKAGKSVSIVHGTPELGFDPISCAPLRPYVIKAVRDPCAFDRLEFDNRTQEYRERLSLFLSKNPEVQSADISLDLCDERLCYAAQNGIVLYADDDHLGRAGVLHLHTHITRQLGELTSLGN